MQHNKVFSAAIALCVIAFFAVGPVHSASAATQVPVTITAVFDFSTFPNLSGNFTTTGALTISGTEFMHVDLNPFNGISAHCVVTMTASNGTIIIDQKCQFASCQPKGRWEMAAGTDAYANLT